MTTPTLIRGCWRWTARRARVNNKSMRHDAEELGRELLRPRIRDGRVGASIQQASSLFQSMSVLFLHTMLVFRDGMESNC
jgi:hypothetical protein